MGWMIDKGHNLEAYTTLVLAHLYLVLPPKLLHERLRHPHLTKL